LHEVLNRSPREARILDLGSGPSGSFSAKECSSTIIRCDLCQQSTLRENFVCADARMLPFASNSFDGIVLNHSLEHFIDPGIVLDEIGRMIRRPGWLWVAVPDGSTLSDWLYRWVSRGGGHVNQFSDITALTQMITDRTALPHAGTRLLFSSYEFLNRHNGSLGFGRRMYLFGRGAEWVLRAGTLVLRKADLWLGTRTSVYGWGCYFGHGIRMQTEVWSNVCIRCGSASSSEWLSATGLVRHGLFVPAYCCPRCGAKNYFTDDRRFSRMR